MGSTAKGLITGFICRLCSKMNRFVILIYGEDGERLGLADKINSYLPITVNRHDPLPKTVCLNCVDRLETHTRMVQMITAAESRFKSKANLDDTSNDDSESDCSMLDSNSNSDPNYQISQCRLSSDDI